MKRRERHELVHLEGGPSDGVRFMALNYPVTGHVFAVPVPLITSLVVSISRMVPTRPGGFCSVISELLARDSSTHGTGSLGGALSSVSREG